MPVKALFIPGSLPAVPLLNSNYDASFIAGILQLRYIYSMPVERIIKLFAEHGFEMNKATAHGLIKKRPVCLTWLKMFSKRLSSRTII